MYLLAVLGVPGMDPFRWEVVDLGVGGTEASAAGVAGAGVEGAGVAAAGVDGAGVAAAGVVGAGVEGASTNCNGEVRISNQQKGK